MIGRTDKKSIIQKFKMENSSYFESRKGTASDSADAVFNFVTDLRNFERFIPGGSVNNWNAVKDSCSFSVSMIGNVSVRIAEQQAFTKVTYCGDALKKEDFTLTIEIGSLSSDRSEIKLHLIADLNPIMKMMAAKPVAQFLEILITEIERFGDWRSTKE